MDAYYPVSCVTCASGTNEVRLVVLLLVTLVILTHELVAPFIFGHFNELMRRGNLKVDLQ